MTSKMAAASRNWRLSGNGVLLTRYTSSGHGGSAVAVINSLTAAGIPDEFLLPAGSVEPWKADPTDSHLSEFIWRSYEAIFGKRGDTDGYMLPGNRAKLQECAYWLNRLYELLSRGPWELQAVPSEAVGLVGMLEFAAMLEWMRRDSNALFEMDKAFRAADNTRFPYLADVWCHVYPEPREETSKEN